MVAEKKDPSSASALPDSGLMTEESPLEKAKASALDAAKAILVPDADPTAGLRAISAINRRRRRQGDAEKHQHSLPEIRGAAKAATPATRSGQGMKNT